MTRKLMLRPGWWRTRVARRWVYIFTLRVNGYTVQRAILPGHVKAFKGGNLFDVEEKAAVASMKEILHA